MQSSSVPPAERLAEDFEAWVRPHVSALHRFAVTVSSSAEADDIVQEAMSRAWQKWHLYDAARGSARAWLLAVLMDQAKHSRRARHVHLQLRDADAVGAGPDPSGVDLRRAVDGLPLRQRLAIVLFYYVDLPLDDVAHVMQCSPGTVKSTLSDARGALRGRLGDSYG